MLHEAMKHIMGDDVMLIGFTGTPLLHTDKKKSIETFGSYIHSYKFNEAVEDGVILDLRYEARNVEQYLGKREKIDEWFDAKTRGLSSVARAALKERWAKMEKLFSSKERIDRIVADICQDMSTKRALAGGYGNAMLVADSILSGVSLLGGFSIDRVERALRCGYKLRCEYCIGKKTSIKVMERPRISQNMRYTKE